jgi:hypothetical protein
VKDLRYLMGLLALDGLVDVLFTPTSLGLVEYLLVITGAALFGD